MAKLYKVELYVADYNDVYSSVDDLVDCLGNGWGLDDVLVDCFSKQEVEIAWTDNIKLNYNNNTRDEYEKYFD